MNGSDFCQYQLDKQIISRYIRTIQLTNYVTRNKKDIPVPPSESVTEKVLLSFQMDITIL